MSRYYWKYGPGSIVEVVIAILGWAQVVLITVILSVAIDFAIESYLQKLGWLLFMGVGMSLVMASWLVIASDAFKENLVRRPRRGGMI